MIKNEQARKEAAAVFADLYDSPPLGRLARAAWLAGYQTAERDVAAEHHELVTRMRAAARFYEERDKGRLARIKQLVTEAEDMERDHDLLLRQRGGEV